MTPTEETYKRDFEILMPIVSLWVKETQMELGSGRDYTEFTISMTNAKLKFNHPSTPADEENELLIQYLEFYNINEQKCLLKNKGDWVKVNSVMKKITVELFIENLHKKMNNIF